MPHLEVKGSLCLAKVFQAFQSHACKEGQTILKAQGCYLGHNEYTLLFDLVVAEEFLRQNYFVLCSQRERSVLVRLLPRTSPEKTDGVKRSVAWIAGWIHGLVDENAEYGTTNLEDEFRRPFPKTAFPS